MQESKNILADEKAILILTKAKMKSEEIKEKEVKAEVMAKEIFAARQ